MFDRPGQWIVRLAPLAGLFFILTVAPFFFTTALRDIFTFPKALPISVGTALLWITLSFKGASFKRVLTPGIAAVFAALIVSACFSVDKPLSILGPHQQQFYALLPLMLCALAYYAAANVDVSPDTYITLALAGGVAVSLVAMTQIGGHGFMSWTVQGDRAGSTFGTPIFLGIYLSVLLPLAWTQRTKHCVVLCLLTAALLATGSRGSLLAAAAGVLLVEHLRGRKVTKLLWVIAPAILLICVWRFHHRATSSDSDFGRFEIWRIAIMSWKSYPILGWGPDTFALAFRQFMTQRFIDASNGSYRIVQLSAHNDVLQVLATMGLLGLACYTFLSYKVVRLLQRALALKPDVGIAGALAALFISSKLNPVPLVVLVIVACLLGSLDRGEQYPTSKPKAALLALASLIVVLVVSVMCLAEKHERDGENLAQLGMPIKAASEFNVAAQINPFDIWYTQRQLDYFWTVFRHMPGRELNGEKMAAFSHRVAERNAQLHPYDPTAYEMRALSYLFEGDMLGRILLADMDKQLAIAERLAPRFTSYTQRRDEIESILHQRK